MHRIVSRFALISLAVICLFFPAVASAQEEPPSLGLVQGKVSNLTAGSDPITDIPITLFVLQEMEPRDIFTSTVAADGRFTFADVPLVTGQLYIATIEYQKVAFGSSFVEYDGTNAPLQLEIVAYETTTDPEVISIGRLHVIVDFVDGLIQISELYIFDNLGDRVFVGSNGDPDQGTLELELPAGIENLQIQRAQGDSMVPTVNMVPIEGGLLDTIPVRPGSSVQQLVLIYDLPYSDQASFSHALRYPANSISLIMPDLGLAVESDVLENQGLQSLMGASFVEWSTENLTAGETIAFQISGEPDFSRVAASMDELPPDHPDIGQTSSPAQETSPLFVQAGDNAATWAIGIGGLTLSAAAIAFFWTRRPAAGGCSQASLLQAMLDLEAAHAGGEISHGRYELERERIKSDLRHWYQE